MTKTNLQLDLAILNGNIIIPDDGVYKANLYIKNGKINSISKEVLDAKETIDATGKYIAPGIIDPHVHFGLFASLKDELDSESKAALVGGVTTVGDFFGGPQSHLESFPGIRDTINEYSYVDMIPHLIIGSEEQKSEIAQYVDKFGVKSFKIYLNGVPGVVPWVDDEFILGVMDEIKENCDDGILCTHAENAGIVANASEKMRAKKSGKEMNTVLWAETHPRICEEEAVNRISELAKYNEFPIYIVHLFTKLGVDAVSKIRLENKYVNVETTSPYLSTTKHGEQGDALKMEPPFHGEEDMEALWKGIEEGVIDTIGTDNVTMTREEKALDNGDYWNIMPGYSAVEHHLPVVLSEGVNKRNVPIERVIACMTKNPAQKFGVYPRKGSFNVGADADVVIIDLDLEKTVTAEETVTRSDFSIYEGRTLKGWPVMTIKNGIVVVKDGEVVEEKRMGECLVR